LWKLVGLSEYDIRRPMMPTGTNLLGLVKHVASVEARYFGDTFGLPLPEPLSWMVDGAEPNADMWATADESARADRRVVPPCVGTLGRHDRHAGAGRDRSRAVVAERPQRGDPAPDLVHMIRRDRPARWHRQGTHRRGRWAAGWQRQPASDRGPRRPPTNRAEAGNANEVRVRVLPPACGRGHDERNRTSVDAVRVPGRAGGERGLGHCQIAA